MRVIVKVGLLIGTAVLATPAMAQGADASSDRSGKDVSSPDSGAIIVTAQRREQSIMSVPLAMTAVSGDSLASKGVTTTNQLASIIPNLQVNSAFGTTQPNFSLRGVSVANEFNVNQVSPIGVYMDDVYLANRTSQGQGLYDLQRVEVLRGPQGTLFGRNTTGGAINLITKSPMLSGSEGYLQVGYGNYNTFTAQGAVESTLVEDQVGVRVAANLVEGDGKFHNVYPGARDAGSEDVLQGRISLRIRPGAGPVDIKIRAYGGRSSGTQSPDIGSQAAHAGLGFYQINDNKVGNFNTEAYGVAANVKWDVSTALSIISITSYDAGQQFLDYGADGSPLDLLITPRRAWYRQWSEELRMEYTAGPLTFVGGAYYGWDTVRVHNKYLVGAPVAGLPFAVGYDQMYRQTRNSTAIFGQADYELTHGLTLTLGARYTWDRGRYRDGRANLFAFADDTFSSAQTVLAQTVFDPADPSKPFSLNGSNKALTGRVALSYTFGDGALAYVSYNRGYRSGAFNGGSYTSPVGINYIAPETVNAYEAGLKGHLGPVTYSLAGFYYDYLNQQLTDLRPGPISFLVNAPKSRILGAELETSTRLSSMVDIKLSLAYLDAKYQQLTLQGAVLDGNRLPFAPRFNLHASADIRLIDDGIQTLTLSPSVSHNSQQWFSPFNGINAVPYQVNSELQQRAYTKVDVNLAYKRGPVTVTAWGKNIFNEKTYSYGLDLRGAGFPFNLLVPDAPPTFGGSVRYAF